MSLVVAAILAEAQLAAAKAAQKDALDASIAANRAHTWTRDHSRAIDIANEAVRDAAVELAAVMVARGIIERGDAV